MGYLIPKSQDKESNKFTQNFFTVLAELGAFPFDMICIGVGGARWKVCLSCPLYM